MRQSMRDAFDHSLTLNADAVAIEFGEERITYAALGNWASAVAAQLSGLGVGPGDPVAIYLHNCPAFFAVDIAIARLGAVKVPLNYMLPIGTVAHCLTMSGARVLVTGTRLVEEAGAASADLPDLVVLEAAENS